MSLYVPTDIREQHDAWGANCGPFAVAALLGRQVADVRKIFTGWPGYTNPTTIRTAIMRAHRTVSKTTLEHVRSGLGFVQFEGPWEKGGARAAYAHTHWVALARRTVEIAPGEFGGDPVLFVYDTASGGDLGGWLPIEVYSEHVAPLYFEPKATGFRFRQVLEVGSP